MHIVVHDYAGHPFQVELSRELARRGHKVNHIYFAGDQGPKGRMNLVPDEIANLSILGLSISKSYSKKNFAKRRSGDIAYGKEIAIQIRLLKPDLVISANTPTETQSYLIKASKEVEAKFIYWCQDFYSIAATNILQKKIPILGNLVGKYYQLLDRQQMLASDHVIHITESFLAKTDEWRIDRSKTSVIPNWGTIDDIPLISKPTAWQEQNIAGDKPIVLYSGTLALKHNPDLLFDLANNIDAEVVVVSAGVGADYLKEKKDIYSTSNLHLLPLQPFELLGEVLGSADVLVAIIEEDAGEYSVPSKILSYLCAGKPIVLAAPSNNLAAEILIQNRAGTVVSPTDINGFINSVNSYLHDHDKTVNASKNGRHYAEQNFNISVITKKFEELFSSTIK